MYIDIHSHHPLQEEGVVQLRSYRYGVDDLSELESPCSVGIHPWDVETQDYRDAVPALKQFKGRIAAIGEIGMDSAKKGADVVRQRIFFENQVRLAVEMKLPIIIHSVRQHALINDLLWILRSSLCGVVIHNFIGSQPLLDDYLRVGCCISLSHMSVAKLKSHDLIKNIPDNRLFLESDESLESIKDLYAKVAEIRGIETEQLVKIIKSNYDRIFGAK